MKKLDIMNNRKNETWKIVDGKVQRIEKIKVTGPIVINAIQEIEEVKLKEDKKILKKKKKKAIHEKA